MAKALRLTHYPVQPGLSLAAYLPPTLDRCGEYVLHFDDGLYYVGQATDVVRRFIWHRRHQPRPIVGISYGPVPKQALNDIERRTVRSYEEAGHRLRNIDLVGCRRATANSTSSSVPRSRRPGSTENPNSASAHAAPWPANAFARAPASRSWPPIPPTRTSARRWRTTSTSSSPPLTRPSRSTGR